MIFHNGEKLKQLYIGGRRVYRVYYRGKMIFATYVDVSDTEILLQPGRTLEIFSNTDWYFADFEHTTNYKISWELDESQCTYLSENENTVNANASYSATLTVRDGYELTGVTVTMDSKDITSSVYNSGVISISKVTGNVVITVVTEAQATTTYSITYKGDGGYTKSNVSSVEYADASYATTLTPLAHYELTGVIVKMGGVDITSSVSNGKQISIPRVTDNVEITVKTYHYTEIDWISQGYYTVGNRLDRIKTTSAYTTTITGVDGYDITGVVVTMGGANRTDLYDADTNTLSIPSVTGDQITIEVKTVAYYKALLDTDGNYTLITEDDSTHIAAGEPYLAYVFPNNNTTKLDVSMRSLGLDYTALYTAYGDNGAGKIDVDQLYDDLHISVTTSTVDMPETTYTVTLQGDTDKLKYVDLLQGWIVGATVTEGNNLYMKLAPADGYELTSVTVTMANSTTDYWRMLSDDDNTLYFFYVTGNIVVNVQAQSAS